MKTYEKRNKEMLNLYKEGFTLQFIGNKYGISRERVRQILERFGTYNGFNIRQERTSLLSKEINNMSYDEFCEESKKLRINHRLGVEIRKGQRHPLNIGDRYRYKAYEVENMVSETLKLKGISNELMPNSYSFDILIRGKIRVDVKSAYKSAKTSKNQKSPLYRMSVRKRKKRDYCDFFISYIPETKDFFVIPNSEVGYVDNIYIGYPKIYKEVANKWHIFKNRFDLLEK